MTRDELIAFEETIAEDFNAGKIPYPVHLSEGNENQLIEIFENVREHDWIFGSWRLHYHALLKNVPPAELKAAIYRGESMALSFPEQRVFGSAIVSGILPIALGAAMSIARRGLPDTVWVFSGDMSAETGTFHECRKYAANHELPIEFVVEDNGISVCTDTSEVWGLPPASMFTRRYCYKSKFPHAGAGERVQF